MSLLFIIISVILVINVYHVMFIALHHCRAFELSVRSYAGDDPLDPWDK